MGLVLVAGLATSSCSEFSELQDLNKGFFDTLTIQSGYQVAEISELKAELHIYITGDEASSPDKIVRGRQLTFMPPPEDGSRNLWRTKERIAVSSTENDKFDCGTALYRLIPRPGVDLYDSTLTPEAQEAFRKNEISVYRMIISCLPPDSRENL